MPNSPRVRWILLLVITLLIRGAVLYGLFGDLAKDPDGYGELAENIAREGIYGYGQAGDNIQPTAYRPPLYPLVLSTAMDSTYRLSRWRVALLHLAFGTATVMLTLDLGERLKLGSWSYLAAVLVCLDPILLNQSALVMTETLATFLAVLCLWCLTRLTLFPEWWNALLSGGALGLAALCRPTFLPWIGLIVVALTLLAKISWSHRAINTALIIAGAILFLLPWGIRNRMEMGRYTFTTTHGGYTLLLGNNRRFFDHVMAGRSLETFRVSDDDRTAPINPSPVLFDSAYRYVRQGGLTEYDIDSLQFQEAIQAMKRHPSMFAYACVYRLYQLFNPLPHPTSDQESLARRLLRYAVAAWYVVLYLFAAVGCIRLRKDFCTPPWLWGVLLVLTFMAVHTFYWTNIRMRAPLMPFICLVAAAGALHLAEPLAHASLLRRKKMKAC